MAKNKMNEAMPRKPVNEDEPFTTHIVGSGNGHPGTNVASVNRHDGIIVGGSVTSARVPVDPKSINRLPGREDGRIV